MSTGDAGNFSFRDFLEGRSGWMGFPGSGDHQVKSLTSPIEQELASLMAEIEPLRRLPRSPDNQFTPEVREKLYPLVRRYNALREKRKEIYRLAGGAADVDERGRWSAGTLVLPSLRVQEGKQGWMSGNASGDVAVRRWTYKYDQQLDDIQKQIEALKQQKIELYRRAGGDVQKDVLTGQDRFRLPRDPKAAARVEAAAKEIEARRLDLLRQYSAVYGKKAKVYTRAGGMVDYEDGKGIFRPPSQAWAGDDGSYRRRQVEKAAEQRARFSNPKFFDLFRQLDRYINQYQDGWYFVNAGHLSPEDFARAAAEIDDVFGDREIDTDSDPVARTISVRVPREDRDG